MDSLLLQDINGNIDDPQLIYHKKSSAHLQLVERRTRSRQHLDSLRHCDTTGQTSRQVTAIQFRCRHLLQYKYDKVESKRTTR